MATVITLLDQFKKKNPQTTISKTIKATHGPVLNDCLFTAETSNLGRDFSESLNIFQGDILENIIQASTSHKTVDSSDAENMDSNETKLCATDQCILYEEPDGKSMEIEELMQLDIERYLDIQIITNSPIEDGFASGHIDDKAKTSINKNHLTDLDSFEPLDYNQSYCIKSNDGISVNDDKELFESVGKSKSDSEMLLNSPVIDQCRPETKSIEKTANNPLRNGEHETNNREVIAISSDDDCIEEMPIIVLKNTMQQSSKEKLLNDTNYDSDCSGYHSSDFEFITESEAQLEGLIKKRFNGQTTYSNNSEPGPSTSKFLSMPFRYTDEVLNDNDFSDRDFALENKNLQVLKQNKTQVNGTNSRFSNYLSSNCPYNSVAAANSSNLFRTGPSSSNNNVLDNRPVHNAIPDGEEYLDLFRGIYDPNMPMSTILMMENKSVRTTSMNVEFEGIGFDMRLMRNYDDSSQEEFEDEAQDSIQKIVDMYPGDNRKRRRRH